MAVRCSNGCLFNCVARQQKTLSLLLSGGGVPQRIVAMSDTWPQTAFEEIKGSRVAVSATSAASKSFAMPSTTTGVSRFPERGPRVLQPDIWTAWTVAGPDWGLR